MFFNDSSTGQDVSLFTRLRRRWRKYRRRSLGPLESTLGHALEAILEDPGLALVMLFIGPVIWAVIYVLGGAAALGSEAMFRGGPPQGLGLG